MRANQGKRNRGQQKMKNKRECKVENVKEKLGEKNVNEKKTKR